MTEQSSHGRRGGISSNGLRGGGSSDGSRRGNSSDGSPGRVEFKFLIEARLVLLGVSEPNNLLFFLALVILDVLALPHMDFYPFLFLVYMRLVGLTCREPDL